ncbi:MAG: hypothetical protein WEE66_01025 [Actinomycetota bacterium]
MRRFLGVATAAAMLSSIFLVTAPQVWALSCVPEDLDALTFHEMIDQGTTGKQRYPMMILGVASSIEDVGGDPDSGRTIARLDVVQHPAGYAPIGSRVRFWRESPEESTLYRFQFKDGGRYVVIARRLDDASLGNVESGAVASVASVPFAIVSGGLLTIVGAGVLRLFAPGFWRYDAREPNP